MDANREKLLYAALMVAEAAWLYVLAALIGLVLQLGGAPLSWGIVTLLLGGAMLVGWVALGIRGETATLALLQGGLGLVVVYAAVAARSGDGFAGLQWTWVSELVQGGMPGRGVATAIFGAVFAIFLWRRGIMLITDDPAWEKLRRTFRIGVMVIAVALIVEIGAHRDIGARNVLFPFFAAALSGMAFGHLADAAGKRMLATWSKVIAAAVGGILTIGVLLGLAGSAYGGGPLRLMGVAAAAARDGLLWLVSLPLRWIVTGLFILMRWLRDLFGTPKPVRIEQPPGPFVPDATAVAEGGKTVGADIIELILTIIQYPLMMLVVLGILYLLIVVFRKWRGSERGEETVDRETIRDGVDPAHDLAALLARLWPGYGRQPRPGPEIWLYPQGQPGITEVFRLYFDYLSEAIRKGMKFQRSFTPTELVPHLSEALPGAPVSLMTERFNAACYGHEPTAPGVLADLEAGLRDATHPSASLDGRGRRGG
ncbi:MAG: DUF4129 domain-containing protein [Chloroflexi bacterium]|nr:DUF4129 domain-containing protein [Chloroflexota bacterium]